MLQYVHELTIELSQYPVLEVSSLCAYSFNVENCELLLWYMF
jgi:hypothetical protein